MDQSSFDRIARLLGDSTTRRAGILAALGLGAVDVLASDRAETRRKRDDRHDRHDRRDRRAANRDDQAGRAEPGSGPGKPKPTPGDPAAPAAPAAPADRGNGASGASPTTRPGSQGPCGDGSVSDNRCTSNGDCCTNYCSGKRCRCKSRGMACATRKECCRGLVCTAGACSEPAAGPTGPGPGPAPTGPTGPVPTPTGPTGAVIYNQGGAFGSTSALFYDYAVSGNLGVGTAGPTGALHVANAGLANPALVIQAATGQTGPLSLWHDGSGAELFRLTGDGLSNLFLGNQAGGASITNGDDNVGIGKSVLKSVTSAYRNVAVGNYALENMVDGNSNIAVGHYAMNAATESSYNTVIGRDAGYSLTSGGSNILIGYEALYNGTTAGSNVAIGNAAGYDSETAKNNVFVGENAGNACVDGESNTYIGYYAGDGDSYGSFNTYLGAESGGTSNGDNNIAIGYGAWVASETGSNQLSIGNLIYGTGLDGYEGTVSAGKIGIGVKAPTQKLEVDGNVKATNVTVPSDLRLKQDIAPVSGALETVNALRPVTYGWKDTTRFGEKREYGLIAQEVAPVVPSVVHGSEADEFALDYAKLVPVLIGAIQELQAEIATLKRGDA